MANITVTSQLDMTNITVWFGVVSSYSSTQITITAGELSAQYLGSFTYDSYGYVYGQLNGYVSYSNGSTDWSASGINLDANWVMQMIAGGNAAQVIAAALAGADRLDGAGLADTLLGHAGNDTLYGNSGNDVLNGGNGGDILLGGLGADRLDGGAGIDRAQYSAAAVAVRADLQFAALNTGEATGDVYLSIENLHGSKFGDDLRGNAGGNTLWGWDGNDILHGRAGNDVLNGGNGGDILLGGLGADRLDGGAGIDRAQYSAAAVAVRADLQFAALNTGEATGDIYLSIENLHGSTFGDDLRGNAGNNTIWGWNGNDILNGRAGNDVLAGGAGNDVLLGGVGADRLDGGVGTDRAQYSNATVAVRADLQYYGSANTGEAAGDVYISIENLHGSGYNDDLRGNAQNNTLWGWVGNDILNGRAGNDVLAGGNGADVFIFNTALGAGNIDRVTDFSVIDDTIRLENAIFTGLANGVLTSAAFVANATGLAVDALDRIIYETDTGNLFFDADGTGAAARVQFAHLNAGLALTNADFLVI